MHFALQAFVVSMRTTAGKSPIARLYNPPTPRQTVLDNSFLITRINCFPAKGAGQGSNGLGLRYLRFQRAPVLPADGKKINGKIP